MKHKNSSICDINYHPTSLSTVDFSFNTNSSIETDIKLEVYRVNSENLLKQIEVRANKLLQWTRNPPAAAARH